MTKKYYSKFRCCICGEELTTYRGKFKKHIEEIHKLNFEDYLRTYHPELGGYCGVCGKPTNFITFNEGFHKYCSLKCSNNASETKQKKKDTCILHYGVDHNFKSKEIQNQRKNTWLEKYGVDNPAQNKEIKNKIEHTNIKKYGTKTPAQSKEVFDKMKKTTFERYGVENVFQLKEIQTQIKKSSIPKLFNKHLEICKRLDIEILETPEEWYYKEWELGINTHRFHCNIHDFDFESEWFCDRNLCPECRKAMYSKGEREVGDYIESLGFQIIRNDRSMIKPKEIDIWIPSRNIGIEYNGEYWHKDIEKDQEKKLLCESKGIRLFTVWDTQWENDKEEVKEYLRRLLNK